jgi:signal transduction histidine kinase
MGLKNIEERLSRAYGEQGTLRLISTAGSGTTAEVRLPFTRAPAAVAADPWQVSR